MDSKSIIQTSPMNHLIKTNKENYLGKSINNK
jgi:hypothetical protein